MTKTKKIVSWIGAIVAALIMLQTLYFKFTASPESVYIFTTLGLEPQGRIVIGIAELIASILILIPKSRIFGAIMGIGIMMGALSAHLTKLGIKVQNDGGYLFILALLVLISCLVCLFVEREKVSSILKSVFSSLKK